MTTNPRRGIACLLVAFALALAPPAKAAERITFAIPAPLVAILSLYIAQDTDIWKDAGLDVTIVTIPSVGGMNAVIAGSADFSFSTGAAITRAAAKGQKLLAIAGLADQTGQVIVLRKDIAAAAQFDPTAPLTVRAKILRDRTLAIGGTGSIADAFTRVVARAGGVARPSRRNAR